MPLPIQPDAKMTPNVLQTEAEAEAGPWLEPNVPDLDGATTTSSSQAPSKPSTSTRTTTSPTRAPSAKVLRAGQGLASPLGGSVSRLAKLIEEAPPEGDGALAPSMEMGGRPLWGAAS